jgi:hypothetical protein
MDALYEAIVKTNEYQFLLKSLLPLVESINASSDAKNMLKPYSQVFRERSGKMAKRALLLKEDLKVTATNEITALRKAFCYLGFFESSLTTVIDTMLTIFVVNHHDFYEYDKRCYAVNIDDLDNASIGQKLAFLNFHGLQVLSNNINSDLRNKVAHMDSDIEPNGQISFGRQRVSLEKEIDKLATFVLLTLHVLESSGFTRILATL